MEQITGIGMWIFKIAVVCLLAFVSVWYFGQKVSTVGDSMKPVLQNGDVVLVNRIVYNASRPKRGDIIVFKPKGNENSHYYIKRIIGLPGETVQIVDGYIYINGKQLDEHYGNEIIEEAGMAAEPVTLGEDEYFVMGDNRNNSQDSRVSDVGAIHRDELMGRAWIRIWPLDQFGVIKHE